MLELTCHSWHAKYYSHTTQTQYEKHTLHSNNMYQIFTYVKNRDYEFGDEDHKVSGMLLYAKTDEEIQPDNVYQMHGNQISVRTLDLNKPFSDIAKQLNTIAETHFDLSKSDIPDIYQVWENEGWPMPVVEESYNPDRTRLSLEFRKQANKTSEQNKHRKTEENYQLIRKYLKENGLSKTTDIAQAIGLSPARTRAILKEMSGLEYEGTTNNRRYRLADDN